MSCVSIGDLRVCSSSVCATALYVRVSVPKMLFMAGVVS